MSNAEVFSFLNRADNDPELKHKLMSVPASTTHIIRLANEAGYQFTVEELRTVLLQHIPPANEPDELSDAQLDAVQAAGGLQTWTAHLYRMMFAAEG